MKSVNPMSRRHAPGLQSHGPIPRIFPLENNSKVYYPAISLEVVASRDRWICHAFFGIIGSNNDINVLNKSPLFIDVIRGHTPKVSFTVNDREHHMGYYLVDGIYPS
jgi:hypothetical protein